MAKADIVLADWEAADLRFEVGPLNAPITTNNGGFDIWNDCPVYWGQAPQGFSKGQALRMPLLITCGPLTDPDGSPYYYRATMPLLQFWNDTRRGFAPVIVGFDLWERKRDLWHGITQERLSSRVVMSAGDIAALEAKIQIGGARRNPALRMTLHEFPPVIAAHNDAFTLRILKILIAPYASASPDKVLSFFVGCLSAE